MPLYKRVSEVPMDLHIFSNVYGALSRDVLQAFFFFSFFFLHLINELANDITTRG